MLIADLVIRNASELCTMLDHDAGDALGSIASGSVACFEGHIVWTGRDADLPSSVKLSSHTRTLDASGCTVTPGLVDCHTHVVFAGDRGDELAERCSGVSFLDIARRGGGILATVRATRTASEDRLVELALPRLARLLEHGITTAEAKSGYGLTASDEIKMLRTIGRLAAAQPIDLVPTLLCAHAVPTEHVPDRSKYVDLCIEEIVPEVARLGLARFCDAFVERGAFTVEECRRILARGKDLGLTPRIHADQISSLGAADLAAELGAASADHLENVSDASIAALAKANVCAVLAPVSTLSLRRAAYAPGRKLWDAGVSVALATNVNPGTAMTENASLTLSLACLCNGLTPAEALWAFTRGGARVLGLDGQVGSLEPGKQADLVIHACESHRHLAYHLAVSHVQTVIKRGRVVLERPVARCEP